MADFPPTPSRPAPRPGGFNPGALLVTILLGFLLGGLWYGPFFGHRWLAALGKGADQLLMPPGLPLLVGFACHAGYALAVSWLVNRLDLRGWRAGVGLGLLLGLGVNLTAYAGDAAIAHSGMPLFLIQGGYRVAYALLSGVILSSWR